VLTGGAAAVRDRVAVGDKRENGLATARRLRRKKLKKN
jgi:hypothetical protein